MFLVHFLALYHLYFNLEYLSSPAFPNLSSGSFVVQGHIQRLQSIKSFVPKWVPPTQKIEAFLVTRCSTICAPFGGLSSANAIGFQSVVNLMWWPCQLSTSPWSRY